MDPTIQSALNTLRAQHDKLEAALVALERVEEIENPQKPIWGGQYIRKSNTKRPCTGTTRVKAETKQARAGTIGSKGKTCSKCGFSKPASAFPKVGAQCKACISEYAKQRSAAKHNGNGQNDHMPAATDNPAPPVATGELVCKLCHAPASSPERLARHMAQVHPKVA